MATFSTTVGTNPEQHGAGLTVRRWMLPAQRTAAGPLVTPGHDPTINVPDSPGDPAGSRRQ